MGIRDLFTAPERYASLSGERLGADDMSIFDYVMILLSVVISLGLAKLLENHAHLIKHGKRVTWSAVYLGWLVIMVLAEIDTWASLWQVHTNARWTALDIGLSLLAAALLFYASILSTPETTGDEPIDLWDFHLTNRHRYLWTLVGYMAVGAWLNATLMQQTFSMANVTATLPAIGLMLVAIFIRNIWVQRAVIAAALSIQLVYFAQYLPAIGN